MTVAPTRGEQRLKIMKMIYERRGVRMLENNKQFPLYMRLVEVGDLQAVKEAQAGQTHAYTFMLTPHGKQRIEKRMDK